MEPYPDEALLREAVSAFVAKEITPKADEIDRAGEFPRALFRKLGELGYLGLRYPKEYGGAGASFTLFCAMCEELARGSMSVAAIAAMQGLMGTNFIFKWGTEEQRNRLLVPALAGEKIAAFALTEPGAGSDLGSTKTTAKFADGRWCITGTKTWITSGADADFFTVAALTDPSKGLKGVSFFLVERGTLGLSTGKAIEKLGVRGTGTTEVILDNCAVPSENLLGKEGGGMEQLQSILAMVRCMTGALSVGLARAALADALRYSRERVQFGQPIGKFQAVKLKFGEVATDLEAAKHLVAHAAGLIDAGRPCLKEASMAKLFASEMANRAADEASRVFASYGFSTEYPVQRYLRDARFLLIGGGTSEILKIVIAGEVEKEDV